MNREETLKLLSILLANYPNTAGKIKDAGKTADTWEMVLGQYETEAVYKAARLHMATSKFFPTPADILEKLIRASLIYSEPVAPKRLKPRNEVKTPDGMSETEFLNAIIEDQIRLECEMDGTEFTEDLMKNFLPYEK